MMRIIFFAIILLITLKCIKACNDDTISYGYKNANLTYVNESIYVLINEADYECSGCGEYGMLDCFIGFVNASKNYDGVLLTQDYYNQTIESHYLFPAIKMMMAPCEPSPVSTCGPIEISTWEYCHDLGTCFVLMNNITNKYLSKLLYVQILI